MVLLLQENIRDEYMRNPPGCQPEKAAVIAF